VIRFGRRVGASLMGSPVMIRRREDARGSAENSGRVTFSRRRHEDSSFVSRTHDR
jgi:hypothetical protein